MDKSKLTRSDVVVRKSAYFSACLFNSGISETMLEKDVYEIDMSLVMEKQDFIYLASLAFMGDRGYMGYNLYTFSDCLLTLFHKRGWFDGVKVKFLNLGSISEKVRDLYIEIKEIFLKFKFDVIEA